MNNIETMKLALEGLEKWGWGDDPRGAKKYIATIQEAIEQAQQAEPFCYVYIENGEEFFAPKGAYVPDHAKPLYTSPPPRQPLTIEEIDALYESTESVNWGRSFARAIEAAHGIKENT